MYVCVCVCVCVFVMMVVTMMMIMMMMIRSIGPLTYHDIPGISPLHEVAIVQGFSQYVLSVALASLCSVEHARVSLQGCAY